MKPDIDRLVDSLTDNLADDLYVVLDKYRNQVRKETLDEIVELIEKYYPDPNKLTSPAVVKEGIVSRLRLMARTCLGETK